MKTPIHMISTHYRLISLVALGVVGIAAFAVFALWQPDATSTVPLTPSSPATSTPPIEQKLNDAATNFSASGTIMFNAPGKKPNVPYFVSKNTNKELVMDALSYCGDATWSTLCMAMSVTFDIPFGNKPVVVEGIEEGDTILVRRLRVITDPQQAFFVPPSGRTYMAWPQVTQLVTQCKVAAAMQSHDLTVSLTMKDGSKFVTVEPRIDEIFQVVNNAPKTCGNIGLATE